MARGVSVHVINAIHSRLLADGYNKEGARWPHCREWTTQEFCDRVVAETTPPDKAFVDMLETDASDRAGAAAADGAVIEGAATVFVCHAWQYKLVEVLSCMLEHAKQHPTSFFWFDLFVCNQKSRGDDFRENQEWWDQDLPGIIKAAGTMLVVLAPWTEPITFTRAWCLFEIMNAIQVKADIIAVFTADELEKVKSVLVTSCGVLMRLIMAVDARVARTTRPADKEHIDKAVVKLCGGVFELNTAIKACIRDLMIKTVVDLSNELLKKSKEEGDVLEQKDKAPEAAAVGPDAKEKKSRIAEVLGNTGFALWEIGEYDKAIEVQKRLLEIQLQLEGPESLLTARAYNGVGGSYRDQGKAEIAMEYFTKSLEVYEKAKALLEKDGKTVDNDLLEGLAVVVGNIGDAHSDVGQFDKALENAQKCLSILNQVTPCNNKLLGIAHSNFGMMLSNLKRYEEAVVELKKSVKFLGKKTSALHPMLASALNNLGAATAYLGDYKHGIKYMKRSLDILLQTVGPSHRNTVKTQRSLRAMEEAYYTEKRKKKMKSMMNMSMEMRFMMSMMGGMDPMLAMMMMGGGAGAAAEESEEESEDSESEEEGEEGEGEGGDKGEEEKGADESADGGEDKCEGDVEEKESEENQEGEKKEQASE